MAAYPADDKLRKIEFIVANSAYALTERGLHFLLDNCKTVLERHGEGEIGGLTVNFWYNSFKGRIGYEPVFRLLWVIIRDLQAKNIGLQEVLNEDPGFFMDCMANNNMLPFYQRYVQ
jgi:hypothetical protein